MRNGAGVVPERFVLCSKSIVLECRCGEKLLLLGREADWRKAGRTIFECSGCGEKLSLDDASK
jgi:DNA-directed RNA polymerase subunit RPC12/RpoP